MALFSSLLLGPWNLPQVQAAAGINQQVNFQGKLVNTNGTNIPDGNYNVEFKLYTNGPGNVVGDTGGSLVFTEDHLVNNSTYLSVSSGIFQVNLGAQGGNPLPTSIWNTDTIWLSINLGNTTNCGGTNTFTNCSPDGEMTPMIRFTAAPYALNSGQLGGLTASQFGQLAANQTFTGTNLFQNTSTSAFEVQNAAGSLTALNVDTSTGNISINGVLQTAATASASTNSNALTLQSGNATGTTSNSGNVTLDAGTATGTAGTISIGAANASAITIGHGAIGVTIPASSSLTLGASSGGKLGSIKFFDGANTNTVTLQSGATASSFNITLPTAAGTTGQCVTTTDNAGTLAFGSCAGAGGGGANTALSNLASVAINTSLLPGTAGAVNLGSGTLPFGDLFIAGSSGTPASNNFRITGSSTSGTRTLTLPDATGTVTLGSGFTVNGVAYASTATTLSSTAAGTTGQCLVATTSAAPSWSSCASSGSGVTLNAAYTNGNTITTTDARDVAITLSHTTTDPNFTINIATSSAGKFAVQNNGTDILRVTTAGGTVVNTGDLTISAGNLYTGATQRLSNAGALQNITGFTQSSGTNSITSAATSGNVFSVADTGLNTSGAALANLSFTNANSTSTATTINGLSITPTGSTNSNSNANILNAIQLPNVTTVTNNAFYALNIGTGYNDLLRYNGTQLISGSGLIQNAALDATQSYSNITKVGTLTSGALGSGFSVVNIAQGGTGASSLTSNGVLLGNGTSAISAVTGSANQVLRIPGAGGAPAFGAIDLSQSAAVSNQLAVANGGTGLSSLTLDGILYGNGTSAAGVTAAGTTGQCLVATNSAAPSWGSCGGTGSGVTLQAAYNNSSPVELILNATNGGLTVRDNATPIGSNLLEIQNNGGTSTYFNVAVAGSSFANSFSATGSALSLSGTNTNASATASTVSTLAVTPVGGANANTNANTSNAINFPNVTTISNNTFYGLNFGTGYNDLLRYNGTQLISGSGKLQNAAIDSAVAYSNITQVGTLISGSLSTGFSTVSVAQGGTGQTTFTQYGVLYGNGTSGLGVTAAASGAGLCLVSQSSAAPQWGSCAGTGSGATLQAAYDNGNTINTSSGRDIAITLSHGGTDANMTINIATSATGKFAVQNAGTDLLRVTAAGGTVINSGNLSVTSGTISVGGQTVLDNSRNLQNVTYNGNTIGVSYGGTGAGTFTANGVLLGNGTSALQVTAVGNTGQCLMGNNAAAPTWQACGGSGSGITLQSAYNNSTSVELVVNSTNGGLTVQDASTPIGSNLLEVQSNGGGTTYLAVTTSGTTINGTLSGGTTYTAATAIQAPLFDRSNAGVLNIGTTNATSISLNKNVAVASGANLTLNGGIASQNGYELADAATDNLLVNGDFEQGTYGWSGLGTTTTGGYSGNLTSQTTGPSTVLSDDYIPVDPTKDVLQLEGYFKKSVAGTTPGTLYFGYRAYNSSKTAITTSPCGTDCYFAANGYTLPADGNWHKFNATTTGSGTVYPDFPVGTAYIRVLALPNFGASGDAVTLMDHVTLKRLSTGPLFVGNNFNANNLVDQSQTTQLFTTSSNNLAILPPSSGNVGIGTSSPTAILHVSSPGSGTDLFKVTDTTATAQDVLKVADGGAVTLRNQTDSTTAFQIQSAASGTAVLTADTVNSKLLVRGINSVAALGSNLVTSQDFTSANWTNCNGSGWSGTSTQTTHSSGTTACVSASGNFSVTSGVTYQVSFNLSGNTSGTNTMTVGLGGTAGTIGFSETGTNFQIINITAASTGAGALTFTPTTNFNGTISSISVQAITFANSVQSVLNSDGTTGLEVWSGGSNLNNSFIGIKAGQSITTGTNNVAFGYQALQNDSSGGSNIALGYQTLQNNTFGYNNVALGYQDLQNNINGCNNVALGYQDLRNNTSGCSNIAFGVQTLQNNTVGNYNIAMGNLTLGANTTGNQNIAIGINALLSNGTGSNNTANGAQALIGNTSGSNNTANGTQALYNNTTGSGNTALGYQAGYQDPNISSFVTLGNLTNATVIGYGSQVQGSNSLILGGQGALQANVGIGTTSPTNLLSVSPYVSTMTGTAGTNGATTTTITGVSTNWTTALIGDEMIFDDTGAKGTITAVASTTSLTLSASVTESGTGHSFRIHIPALQVKSNGNVGIGTSSPTAPLNVVNRDTTTSSGTPSSILISTTYSPTSNSSVDYRGLQSNITDGASTTGQYLEGLYSQVTHTSSANLTGGLYGTTQSVYNTGTGGHVGSIYGNYVFLGNYSTATVDNVYGYQVDNLDANYGGTITNTYGIYLGNLVSGTQTNAPYAIYSSSTARSYFGGNVGIGTASPTATLHVVGPNQATAATNATQALQVTGGSGGTAGAAQTGGVGGVLNLTAGTGGAATAASGTPGAGGTIALVGGTGGAGTSTSVNGNGGNISLQGGAAGTGGSGTAGTAGNIILQSSGGNVGIGTASPTATLQVNGDIVQGSGINATGDQESMVPNAGFEIGTGTLATDWTFTQVASPSSSSLDTSSPAQGDQAQQLTVSSTSGGGALKSACFPVTGGQSYSLFALVKSNVATTNGLTIRLAPFATRSNCTSDTSELADSDVISNAAPPTSWTQKGANTSTIAATARWAKVELINYLPSAASTFDFDSVRLTPASAAQSVDLAENYRTSEPVTAGDVVEIAPNQPASNGQTDNQPYVEKSTGAYSDTSIGIISTSPAITLGSGVASPVPVALNGRVPVKIAPSSGTIQPGDYLTASATPGMAMKATHAGRVIGKALEAYDPLNPPADGKIMIFVNPGYADPNTVGSDPNTDIQGNTASFNNLNVTGQGKFGSLVVTGTTTTKDLVVTGTATIGALTVNTVVSTANLSVTGTATVASLVVSGSAKFSGNIILAGVGNINNAVVKQFIATKPIPMGAVVIADPNHDGQVTTTTTPADTRVLGVAATAAASAGDTLQVAIGGSVQVAVDSAAVTPGDLLASSSQEGSASPVTGTAKVGTIIGKATSKPDAQGLAWLLVTLN